MVVTTLLTCTKCRQQLPEDAFSRRSDRPRGRASRCRACIKAYKVRAYFPDRERPRNRRYHAEHGDTIYYRKIRQKFGVTREDYLQRLERQNNTCAVCKKPCASGKRLAVDHCHESGRVRGLLCFNCNTVLGKVYDDPELLRALARYLEEAR